jgi:hypothetical protein
MAVKRSFPTYFSARWNGHRPACSLFWWDLTIVGTFVNGILGLALFDACPSRATSDGLPGPDGQALDKAPGRKPRNEARLFSRGSALWAFERRPIAQVRDVRGAAPGAACCVKALPALGCAGEVRAARLVM